MATNRIKGITIQIGAETTQLTKALKDVNSIISKSNTELKDLNKALKLDPKNTELLAQKQEVLRNNIQASAERLKTLVEAQRQMGDYNKLTDEQKASYRALSVEITNSESAIRKMNSELKETSKVDLTKLKEGLKKVGEVALDVSKKLLQISTAIGGALTSIVGLGVKSYADLEQNIGGIQKLFGESADELIAKSKEAYRTAGLSANQYMETATSFSASLLKGLDGDTEKAVQLTDRAIQDMSDNANTFGSSMEEVMNVYKALSKEQYITLDNLRLGYSGTKTGMKQLIADASTYTDIQKELGITVDASSMSFDNIINAISVMQKHLNITGTTMKEAEGTITGSINQMKAAFDNFLNGTGSPEELSKSIMNVLSNVATAFQKLAPSIISGLITTLKDVIPMLIDIFWELLPTVIDSVSDMIDTLYQSITSDTSSLQETVTMLVKEIVLFITNNLPKIVQIALTLVITLANGIADSLPELIPAIVQCILTIIDTLLHNLGPLIDAAIQIIIALIEGITNALPILIDYLPTLIETIIEVVIDNLPKLLILGPRIIYELIKAIIQNLPKLIEAVPKIIGAIITGIANALPTLKEKAGSIIDTIKSVITTLPDKAKQWGKDMIKGLADGITSMISSVKNSVKKIGDTIKNFLHFSRPDEGPLREYETWMPDFVKGLAEGIRKSSYLVEDASLDLANDMSSSILGNTSRALRGLNSGISTSLNPTINPSIAYDLNYKLMANAMKEALAEVQVELDDRELGRFVDKQVSEEVYS